MATRDRELSMKLLIDIKEWRVLFAEASKDVVDFLFSLLSLPVSTVVSLLWTDSMAGSARNLYASFHKLDGAYVLSEDNRNALLFPTLLSQAAAANMSLLRLPDPSPKGFFRCGYCNSLGYVTDERGTKCPRCHYPMKVVVNCVRADSGSSGQLVTTGGAMGFVQGIVTYTVTDSLKVTPMSSISSITLLSTLGVRDFGGLQEKTVRLGYSEGLAILKASLQSKTVLTDVFLGKKRKASFL